jgi:aryl-alcohol dehydrogenase-like predicted oxidoreductase
MTRSDRPPFREEVRRFHIRLPGGTIPLGMGCAYLGGDADTERLQQFQQTLEQAYARGVRYFDTAEMYGGSEFRLGRFVRSADRSSLFLATKSRVIPSLTPEEAAWQVRQYLHNSLERLGTDYLDLYQIHDVNTLDQVLAAGGVLETLLAAKQEGLIRYIGLATRWHDLSETAAAHPGFDTVLTHLDYTLLDQSARLMIEFAAQRGVGVINASPLGSGLLTGRDPRLHQETYLEVRRYRPLAIKLYDFCQERGISLLAMALQYPMLHPGISITLTGPSRPQELNANLDACQKRIAPEVWRELHARFGLWLPDL